eukprot:3048391-Alexandrium_andersonii.AAC.1
MSAAAGAAGSNRSTSCSSCSSSARHRRLRRTGPSGSERRGFVQVWCALRPSPTLEYHPPQ